MTKAQAIKCIRKARELASESIRKYIGDAAPGRERFFASGMASEGYDGGYRDALDDVELLLNGVPPKRRGYWDFMGTTE